MAHPCCYWLIIWCVIAAAGPSKNDSLGYDWAIIVGGANAPSEKISKSGLCGPSKTQDEGKQCHWAINIITFVFCCDCFTASSHRCIFIWQLAPQLAIRHCIFPAGPCSITLESDLLVTRRIVFLPALFAPDLVCHMCSWCSSTG